MAKQLKNEQKNNTVNHLEISKIANHLAELGKLQMSLILELKKHIEKPDTNSGSLQ